ncbi:MAG: hypothetical protein J7J87_02820 [Candidatus Diapherotrites archaeon]|nr:hypothetical protein [Candidatus Diapherotrites archaeon]
MKKLCSMSFKSLAFVLCLLLLGLSVNAYLTAEIVPKNTNAKVLELYPDEIGEYEIKVTNTSAETIELVNIKVDVSDSLALIRGLETRGYETEALRAILPNEERSMSIIIKPLNKLRKKEEKNLITVYYGTDRYTHFTGTYVEVIESPLEVKAYLKKPTMNKGEENYVEVEIKNKSGEQIKGVEISLLTPTNFDVKEKDYNIVYLNPGDSFKKSFYFSPAPTVVGTQYVALRIEFEDARGKHILEKNFTVEIQDKAIGASILLAIIIALILVYLMTKKQKKAQQ